MDCKTQARRAFFICRSESFEYCPANRCLLSQGFEPSRADHLAPAFRKALLTISEFYGDRDRPSSFFLFFPKKYITNYISSNFVAKDSKFDSKASGIRHHVVPLAYPSGPASRKCSYEKNINPAKFILTLPHTCAKWYQ